MSDSSIAAQTEPFVARAKVTTSGNAFDALRVCAALWVLFSHSYALFGLSEPVIFVGHPNPAVDVFFAISGYLVIQSWERDPDIFKFFAKRLLRIFPGLIFCLFFTVFVIGLLVTKLERSVYLSDAQTWQYITSNIILGLYQSTSRLPGVFEENIYPYAVNGSLWTLRYEVAMYVVLALLGGLSKFSKRSAALRYVCLLALVFFIILSTAFTLEKQLNNAWSVPFFWRLGLDGVVSQFGVNFFAGCCLQLFRDRLKLSRILAGMGLILAALMPYNIYQCLIVWLFVPYASVVFAWRAPSLIKRFKNFDYSYGIYIYAFPIQQLVSLTARERGWGFVSTLSLSVIATFILAAISWHLIEKPALQFKPRRLPGNS